MIIMKMLVLLLLVAHVVTLANGQDPSCQWVTYNNRSLIYIPQKKTWADAEKTCQGLGGNLASVHSADEYNTIQSLILIQTNQYPETWIGGFDATQEDIWLWSDGTSFTFDNWADGEPNNADSQHCMLMNFGEKNKFDDQDCSKGRPFVCSKKP